MTRPNRKALILLMMCLLSVQAVAQTPSAGRGLLLADEPVLFDSGYVPVFTRAQIERTAASTRAGLAAWAQTTEGRQWVAMWRSGEYEVVVTEGGDEVALGRVLQPGIATMVATADRKQVKHFYITLNPSVAANYTSEGMGFAEIPTADVAMAAAWAGEMLHVSFYAAGVTLPHHDRMEFQRRWLAVASELGVPTMKHRSESDAAHR